MFGTGKKEWTLVFRGTPGVNTPMSWAYMDYQSEPVEDGCRQFSSNMPCNSHYRNNKKLDEWSNVNEVALVLYKDSRRAAYIVFDGKGSNLKNWFNQSRIITSSFEDIGKILHFNIFFAMYTFLIHGDTSMCSSTKGWVAVIDNDGDRCLWKKTTGGDWPRIYYRDGDDVVEADALGVFVKRKLRFFFFIKIRIDINT